MRYQAALMTDVLWWPVLISGLVTIGVLPDASFYTREQLSNTVMLRKNVSMSLVHLISASVCAFTTTQVSLDVTLARIHPSPV